MAINETPLISLKFDYLVIFLKRVVWSCNVSVSQQKFYIYIKKYQSIWLSLILFTTWKRRMKNIDYAFWKKKNQSVLNLEQNQRILKNYFKVPEYWPYQRTLISFSKYINFVPNLTQF